MKKTDFQKLKTQTQAELKAGVVNAREKLWQVSRQVLGGKTKNVREIRAARVEIAQLLTLLNAKNNVKKVTK